MKKHGLSKSRLLKYLQCPKQLWLSVHGDLPEVLDGMSQLNIAQGHEVGAQAQARFPGGVLIAPDNDLPRALEETRAHLAGAKPIPLFEATTMRDGVLVRADVVAPAEGGGHRLVEVKSSSKVKEQHKADVAVQRWALEGSGINARSATLMHVDTKWEYRGDGDYTGLLVEEDITADTNRLLPQVPTWVESAKAVLAGDEPEVPMGGHCGDPYPCPFQGYCQARSDGPEFPVLLLPGSSGKARARKLVAQNPSYADLLKVPAELLADKPDLARIHEVTVTGRPFLSEDAASVLAELPWPRAYLDFETIAWAVPQWPRTRPHQAVAFQWSCHLESAPGLLEHHEFIDLSGNDPRRACAESLAQVLKKANVVFVYHEQMEKGRLQDMANWFPDLAADLLEAVARVVDLKRIVQKHYYHRDMRGSYSIKEVLPCVLGFDPYADLASDGIGVGGEAQWAYYRLVRGRVGMDQRDGIRGQLLDYCRLDTWSLIALARFLESRRLPLLPK